MTNGFAINHDKSLQIYFFCIKRQAKNHSLKDVESIVVSRQPRKTVFLNVFQLVKEEILTC